MIGKHLVLAAVTASLVVGAAGASFARGPHHGGPRIPPEILYVRMLKLADTNKDGKITPEELKAGVDTLFDTIDTNKDGSLTPGEMRAYHKERMKIRKAEFEKAKAEKDGKAAPDDMSMMPDDGPGPGGPEGKPEHHGKHHKKHGGMRHHGDPMGMFMRMADTDENGQLSKAEAEAAADKLFKRMDRNGDGVVSIDDMPDM